MRGAWGIISDLVIFGMIMGTMMFVLLGVKKVVAKDKPVVVAESRHTAFIPKLEIDRREIYGSRVVFKYIVHPPLQ